MTTSRVPKPLVFLICAALVFAIARAPLLAQEGDEDSPEDYNEQRYTPLERDLLFEYQPLLAFRYHTLKEAKGFHFSVFGLISTKYLANGLPELTDNNTPLWHQNLGWGIKYFIGRFFYNWFFDIARTSNPRPAQGALDEDKNGQWLSSSTINIDLGYAAYRNKYLYITPFVGYGTANYAFDNPQGQRFYTGNHTLGGGIDLSAFFPLFPYPFTPLEERKLGIRDFIEANLSLRAGYARYFPYGVPIASAPLYQEFSLRLMLGVSMGRFVEEDEEERGE